MSEIKRDLKVDKRIIKQLSDSAIKKDPIRAVVELITNSDDSYRRLSGRGITITGIISTEVIRKRKNSIFRVVDYAEGFDADTMDERIGVLGSDTSGLTEGFEVRGYFGRGLKEAILGLGHGTVISIKDGFLYECSLDEDAIYRREVPVKATNQVRKNLGITNNGTIIEITVTKEGVAIPQIENFISQLERYYSLRQINASNKRSVFVVEKDERGNRKRDPKKLEYKESFGKELVDKKAIPINGYPSATVDINILAAEVPLSQDGPCRDGGLLIKGKTAIHDVNLFKYEGDPYAQKIFGSVSCNYWDELLKKGEPVLSDRRDGLDWNHPFNKAVKSSVENELKDVIEKIKKEEADKKKEIENEKTKRRFLSAVERINQIASDELGDEGKAKLKDVEGDTEKPGEPPPNGFDFIPEYYHIPVGRSSTLTLKAVVPWIIENDSHITVESDTEDVVVEKGSFIAKQDDARDGIIVFNPKILGKRVGAEAVITARTNGTHTEAIVLVLSKKEKKDKPEKPDGGKKVLIAGIKYDPTLGPKVRTYFDRETGFIKISSKHPSVEVYLGPNGEGQDELHCQVLVAELITDAVCREIARRRAEGGRITILGERMDAINREHNRLINDYAHVIHQSFVSSEARRNLH